MSALENAFDIFFSRIELDALGQERIRSAWDRLRAHLAAAYRVPQERIFVQGSTANGTAVRPASPEGEIDLDIVVHAVDAVTDPHDAITRLREHLASSKDLKQRLEPDQPGRPCVRLRYADNPSGYGFHIDITPARDGQNDGPLDVPMRGREGWKASAPAEYTRWCYAQGEQFRRTVRELKRWREVHDAEIKSIVLQVLSARSFPLLGSDAVRLTETLEGIRDHLAESPVAPPRLPNPVLPSEDLASRWKKSDYQGFRISVGEAARIARAALSASDDGTSYRLWKSLLGPDFPDPPSSGRSVPPIAPPPAQQPQPDRGRQYGC